MKINILYKIIEKRNQLRDQKKYRAADLLRNFLLRNGIFIIDGGDTIFLPPGIDPMKYKHYPKLYEAGKIMARGFIEQLHRYDIQNT